MVKNTYSSISISDNILFNKQHGPTFRDQREVRHVADFQPGNSGRVQKYPKMARHLVPTAQKGQRAPPWKEWATKASGCRGRLCKSTSNLLKEFLPLKDTLIEPESQSWSGFVSCLVSISQAELHKLSTLCGEWSSFSRFYQSFTIMYQSGLSWISFAFFTFKFCLTTPQLCESRYIQTHTQLNYSWWSGLLFFLNFKKDSECGVTVSWVLSFGFGRWKNSRDRWRWKYFILLESYLKILRWCVLCVFYYN